MLIKLSESKKNFSYKDLLRKNFINKNFLDLWYIIKLSV